MPTETETSNSIQPPIVENIPGQLTERPQWVTWRLEQRDDRTTKVPYTPYTTTRASTTDLLTWTKFQTAVNYYENASGISGGVTRMDGIGFVFCSGDPFVAIDLDDCRDPETGVLEPWAQKIVTAFEPVSYVEASPSKTGVHIITTGTLERAVKTPRVEMYATARFFTVSGVPL